MSELRSERLVEEVREKYGRIAKGEDGGCCGPAAGLRAR